MALSSFTTRRFKPGTTKVKSLKPGGKDFTLLNYNAATVYTKASKSGKAFPLGGY